GRGCGLTPSASFTKARTSGRSCGPCRVRTTPAPSPCPGRKRHPLCTLLPGFARTALDGRSPRRCLMNWDQVKGNWKQVTGKVKEKWGQLTDDDVVSIAGKRDQLAGKLQEKYGYAKEQAERELDDFARSLNM